MAVVLAATGLFLYLRLANELNSAVNRGLLSRAGDVTTLVGQSDSGLGQSPSRSLTARGESFAEILDAHGRVVDATPQLRSRALLSATELRRALAATSLFDKRHPAGLPESARLLATPVTAQDQRLVVLVGASLANRDVALRDLGALLLIGGPVALVLASLAAYGLTGAALRPVDSMRRRAALISASEPGQRLPVSRAPDEVTRLGHTLNDMLARLEAALARERTFVSDASHELRAPLAILKAELELALRPGRHAQEVRGALRSAAEETDRLAQLAEDLLVIARFDQGRLPVRTTEIAAVALLEGVRERFERRARDQDVTLIVEGRDHPTVAADALRLEQAMSNLVENALRHGGATIRLGLERRGDLVELHVRDDGPGFPPAFLPRAFERFTRADPSRAGGGSGLGLAIVQAIAEAHGGTCGARNPPGGGADVWLVVSPGRALQLPAPAGQSRSAAATGLASHRSLIGDRQPGSG